MPERISITVNGVPSSVPNGTTALVAALMSGAPFVRRSVHREPRGSLCGMGVCFECRATINGRLHARSCQILCGDGMDIRTDE